jgi:regulator of sigma E protease
VTTFLAILAAVLAVSLLIIVHEAGHQVAARLSGMRVERFSVGFGPVLLAFKRGQTEYAISALPLGGYVRIRGMGPDEDVAPDDPTSYSNQPAWRRFLVILAGPAMNYVAAVIIAAVLLVVGLPVPDAAPRVGDLVPGMPAAQAGLRTGDRIDAVDRVPVASFLDVLKELQRHPGEEIVLDVDRDGVPLTVSITPRDVGGVGRVGFSQARTIVKEPPGAAIVQGFERTNAGFASQLAGFGQVLSRKGGAELSGPVGIAQELVRGAREGAVRFFTLVWTISIALALLNLLPIPALDGGRLVFLAYEMVTRRRVSERVEGYVHLAGFVLLIGLLLAVTVFGDLARLLGR